MNKKFKKFLCILLSVIIAMSALSVGTFAAADDEKAPVGNRTFKTIFFEYITIIIDFFRYIFFDVWTGADPGPIPDPPVKTY